MKPPFWITIGSYIGDIVLEKEQSTYSGELEVICRNGRYALCTKNAVYSYDDLYINFRESFRRLDLEQYEIKNVLVLGLGLGSIPYLLEKKFKKKYTYTLVEIDQKVVNLATKYTLSELTSPLNIICIDALEYIKSCTATFDFVAVDIFIDDQIPTSFESIQFLEDVKKVLSPNALLMYNRLIYKGDMEIKNNDFFEKKFKKVFKNADCLSLGDNRMLVNKLLLK